MAVNKLIRPMELVAVHLVLPRQATLAVEAKTDDR